MFRLDTDIPAVKQAFTADGTTSGTISVASTIGFYTGQIVTVSDDNAQNITLQVGEVVSTTKLRLGALKGPSGGGGVDLSGYTLANHSLVGAAQQSKGLTTSSNPFTGPYLPDPVAALRVMQVDQSGNFLSPSNVSVSISDAISVTVLNPISSVTVTNASLTSFGADSSGNFLYTTAAVTQVLSLTLSTSYTGTTAVDCTNANQAFFLINYTQGSLTSSLVKVQYSSDNSNWFDESFSDTANETISADEAQIPLRSRVHLLTATCQKALPVPVKVRFVRLMAKGQGTVTGSSIVISGVAGVV